MSTVTFHIFLIYFFNFNCVPVICFLSFPVDNYEDIIPNSLRPSEEDIQRVVRFWDMHTDPLESDFEIGPFLPVIEELGNFSFEF